MTCAIRWTLTVVPLVMLAAGCSAPLESTKPELTEEEEAFFQRVTDGETAEAIAEQGNVYAQYTLGISGEDHAENARWFLLAAEQGHSDAQFFLGILYEDGDGVPQDYIEAHKWYNLSAAGASDIDREYLAKIRDNMAFRLTPDQLVEAQGRAREWQESH